jgi:hypothetical protein
VDPALGTERRPEVLVVEEVAVVAERIAAGRVIERLRVGEGERGKPGGSPEMDERCGRLDRPDRLAAGIVAEGPHVPVGAELRLAVEPCRAPAEPGDPEPLESLRERPQLVEPERFGSPDDEVLTHRAR